jgi:hypothetical protein
MPGKLPPPGRPKAGMPPARPATALSATVPSPVASSPEVEALQRQMDAQVVELQRQLQEEREKILLQKIRAKEEEAMSAKVEESLKDIQDRLRRERREQELQENLAKAEMQIKDLEQRMSTERQTWVETLKTQMTQREEQDRDLEHHFELQMKELERRWHEEKLGWSQAIKHKDEELLRLKKELETTVDQERTAAEQRIEQVAQERDSLRRELKDLTELRQEERDAISQKLEARDKEYLSLKAQQAMIVTQLRQEKEKIDQMRQLLERMRSEKNTLMVQLEGKEKDYFLLKTQFAMYQTKAKAEQEKLLKEMVLFKDQLQKNQQQWEINIRAKENELNTITQASRTREQELRWMYDKKDTEYQAQFRTFEEKITAKDKELQLLHEKDRQLGITFFKYEQQVRDLNEKIGQQTAEIAGQKDMLGRRDSEITSLRERIEQEKNNAAEVIAREKDDYLKKLFEKDAALAALARRDDMAKQRIQTVEQEIAVLKETLGHKEKECSVLLAQLAREKEESQARLVEKDTALAALAQQENAAKQHVQAIEQEISVLKEELTSKEKECSGLRGQAASEKEDHQNRLSEKDAALDALVQQDTAAKQRIQAVEQEVAVLKQNLESKELEYHTLRAQQEELRETAETEKNNNKVLAQEIEARERVIEKLKSEFTIREKDLIYQTGQKVAAYQKEMASLKDAVTQKENELTVLRETADREQKDAAERIAREREDLLQQIKRLEAQYTIRLEEKDAELRTTKERALEMEQKATAVSQEIAAAREAVLRRENELNALRQQLEKERNNVNDTIARERATLMLQANAVKEESQRATNAKTAEIEALKQAGYEARLRLETLQNECAQQNKDLERLRSELSCKDRDQFLQMNQKDAAFHQETCRLQERAQALEREMFQQQKNIHEILVKKEEEWKQKEAALLAENRVLLERQETDKKAKAEMSDMQKHVWDEKEELSGLLREKEEELTELRLARQSFESELRHELETKYKNIISRLEKEKEDAAANVSQEIQALRRSLQSELKLMEEQQEAERAEWKRQSSDRQQREEELQRKQTALQQENLSIRGENENRIMAERRRWDDERRELMNDFNAQKDDMAKKTAEQQLQQKLAENAAEIQRLREDLLKMAAKNEQPQMKAAVNGADSTIVLPANASVSGNGRSGCLGRLWQNLNEPIIEIGTKSDRKNLN